MNDDSQKDVVDLFLPELSMWNSRGISILWRSVSCAVWEEKVENLEKEFWLGTWKSITCLWVLAVQMLMSNVSTCWGGDVKIIMKNLKIKLKLTMGWRKYSFIAESRREERLTPWKYSWYQKLTWSKHWSEYFSIISGLLLTLLNCSMYRASSVKGATWRSPLKCQLKIS